jgi:hypothetical protein
VAVLPSRCREGATIRAGGCPMDVPLIRNVSCRYSAPMLGTVACPKPLGVMVPVSTPFPRAIRVRFDRRLKAHEIDDLMGSSLSRSAPQPARRRAFQGWTRIEAYSKASGEGLDSGLETFEIFLDLRTPVLHRPLANAEQRWWLHDFSPRRGYVGALAAPPGDCSLRYC